MGTCLSLLRGVNGKGDDDCGCDSAVCRPSLLAAADCLAVVVFAFFFNDLNMFARACERCLSTRQHACVREMLGLKASHNRQSVGRAGYATSRNRLTDSESTKTNNRRHAQPSIPEPTRRPAAPVVPCRKPSRHTFGKPIGTNQ